MAVITLNKKEFLCLVGKKLTNRELEYALNSLGIEFNKTDEKEVTVDITANRPDMLSQCGLARAVSSFLEIKKGLRNYKVNKSNYTVKVENPLNEWPYVVTAVVKGLKLNDEAIMEIIQLQEKIGATLLRNRKKGGMGVYPLNKIKFPVRYRGEKPENINFQPLEFPKKINSREILEKHHTGKEYSHIVKEWNNFPIFIDANNTIMSMPPIINSHQVGKITEETRDVFVEATGTDFDTIKTALNILVTSLADMGGKIYSTKIIAKNKIINSPDLNPKKFKIDVNYINKLLGLNLKSDNVNTLLKKMSYGISKNTALVPAYRNDIIHQTDLAEDVAIAYGYEKIKEEIPNVATIGEESRFEVFKRKVANVMVGLGLLEVHTYNLTSKLNQADNMHASVKCVGLANALSEDYNVLRAWVTPSLLQILRENKHNEYPQNLFCFGDVFKYDNKKETGVSEAVRLSIVLCHGSANFTEIKQILDSLMNALDLKYEIKDVDHNSFISGRVGRINVNNMDLAYIGEIHPQVLEEFELEMPVAVLELNLTELFRIIKI